MASSSKLPNLNCCSNGIDTRSLIASICDPDYRNAQRSAVLPEKYMHILQEKGMVEVPLRELMPGNRYAAESEQLVTYYLRK